MADTDLVSAALFAKLFEFLAEAQLNNGRISDIGEKAREVYLSALFYEFTEADMRCDRSLETLGLAIQKTDKTWLYRKDWPLR